jgi:hypothetical protein
MKRIQEEVYKFCSNTDRTEKLTSWSFFKGYIARLGNYLSDFFFYMRFSYAAGK